MAAFDRLKSVLQGPPRKWLVTGAGGFIGSHLVEALLTLGQEVAGMDNFSTGHRENLAEVRAAVGNAWERFTFFESDICDLGACRAAARAANIVLHQAALGSVPRSIADPLATHNANVTGFLNVLEAAREAKVSRFVFASSSAVYGDLPELPKVEERIGNPLSPYAASKAMDETYAAVFSTVYGLETIGLRYFNVFGPRQDPEGPYAAVIPKWIEALASARPVQINGDGETSRDFCYVQNVVEANLLAATVSSPEAVNQVYNIGVGDRTTLNDLYAILWRLMCPAGDAPAPTYSEFRAGDVRHSLADITKARKHLGYDPAWRLEEGLKRAIEHYRSKPRGLTV
ncbi:MAG TPA: SDR family oxidoreductase [Verrucomicrobiae bacterium]|nr:SDR family oxidoreductase [Verrucomicrobiae bacterium]